MRKTYLPLLLALWAYTVAICSLFGCGSNNSKKKAPPKKDADASTLPSNRVEKKFDSSIRSDSYTKEPVAVKGEKDETARQQTDTTASATSYEPPHNPVLRVGRGTKKNDILESISAKWLPDGTPVTAIETLDYRTDTYVLFRLNGSTLFEAALKDERGAAALATYQEDKLEFDNATSYSMSDMEELLEPYREFSHFKNFEMSLVTGMATWSIGLAKLTHNTPPATEEDTAPNRSWTRAYAIILLDGAPAFPAYDTYLKAKPELRVRDMDGDGKAEIKVVFHGAQQDVENYKYGSTTYGAQAFLIDSDGHIQIQFERERYDDMQMQGTMGHRYAATVWQLKDLNDDGHADLQVVNRWNSKIHTWECEEDAEPSQDQIDRGKEEWQCLYSAVPDRWRCPQQKK